MVQAALSLAKHGEHLVLPKAPLVCSLLTPELAFPVAVSVRCLFSSEPQIADIDLSNYKGQYIQYFSELS